MAMRACMSGSARFHWNPRAASRAINAVPSPDGDDEPAHLDVFADVVNGFGIVDHRQLVRTCCNQAKQQPENREQWTHVRAEYSLEF